MRPIEAYRGRKVDYKRDIRIGFGEYAHATRPILGNRNSMTPRTEGVIALLPTGNLLGSVRFYVLETDGFVTRDSWTPLPMTEEVVEKLNKPAGLDKRSPTWVVEFSRGKEDRAVVVADLLVAGERA